MAHKTIIQDTWIAVLEDGTHEALVAQRVREECVHDAQRVCSAELQHTFSHGIAGPKGRENRVQDQAVLEAVRCPTRQLKSPKMQVVPVASWRQPAREVQKPRMSDLLSAKGRPLDADNGPPSFVAVKLQRAGHPPDR